MYIIQKELILGFAKGQKSNVIFSIIPLYQLIRKLVLAHFFENALLL